jgi:hypothetical protein
MALLLDSTVPPGSEALSLGDNRIRALTLAICDIFGITSGVTLSGATGKVDDSGQSPLHVRLSNQTGGGLVAGDVVALSTSSDNAVQLGNTVSSVLTYVVARETIASAATGLFAIAGVISTVNTTGTVTRGDYVRKSATTKVVETTTVSAAATTSPPIGALGIALTTAAANVASIFWFGAGGGAGNQINSNGIVRLTNRTGGTTVIGDVARASTANDSSAESANAAAALGSYVVAAEAMANTVAGSWYQSGIVTAKAQGSIARGDYIRKSATSLAVETTGIGMGGTVEVPYGALGVALAAASGGLVTALWWAEAARPRPGWRVMGYDDGAEVTTTSTSDVTLKTVTTHSIPETAWVRVTCNVRKSAGHASLGVFTLRLASTDIFFVNTESNNAAGCGSISWLVSPKATSYDTPGGTLATSGYYDTNVPLLPPTTVGPVAARPAGAVTSVIIRGSVVNATNTIGVRDVLVEAYFN